MGAVYLADDTDLGRRVALKFLSAGSASDEKAVARFRREARAAAALDHPNICPIYELGQHEDRLFIAMAHVEGHTVRSAIDERPVDLPTVIDGSSQIAAGLHHAHTHGVVHRDIKPENIAVTDDGVVRILDFGLARITGESAVTGKGETLGTLSYMSPEQLRGDAIDHRTDIWSLGVVMYEMVTGRRPFRGDIKEATSYAILNEDPEPVTALRSGVPIELDRIILKALAKDPSHRYQHADELAADLDALASGIHESKHPTVRRGRRAWIVAGIAVMAAAVVAYFARPSRSLPFHNRDWILITDFENHTGEERFDDVVSQALAIDLDQSQYVNVFGGTRLREAMLRMEHKDNESIDAKLGRELCVREGIPIMAKGAVDQLGNGYQVSVELVVSSTGRVARTERAEANAPEEFLTAVDDLSRRVRRHLGESLARIKQRDAPLAEATTSSLDALRYYTVARRHINRGDNEGAKPFLKRAIEADSTFASAWALMALVYNNLGDAGKSCEVSRQSWKYRKRTTERERLYIEAEYFRYRSAYAQATEKFALLTELYPDDFAGHNNLAFLYQSTHEYERALRSLRQAARVRPHSWHVNYNTALSLAGLSRWDSAMVYFNRARAINPTAHWSEVAASWVESCRGNLAGAVKLLSRVPKDGGHWERFRTVDMASACMFAGKEQRARDLLDEQLSYGVGSDGGSGEVAVRSSLAGNMLYAGQYSDAITILSPDIMRDQSWTQPRLVTANARSGDVEAAEAAMERLRALSAGFELYPNRALVPFAEGEIALARGDPGKAVGRFRASLQLDDNGRSHERLAVAYEALGKTDLALAEYNEIIRYPYAGFFDGNPLVWVQAVLGRADLHLRLGNRAAARRDLELLKTVQPDPDDDAYSRRRMLAVERGIAAKPRDGQAP